MVQAPNRESCLFHTICLNKKNNPMKKILMLAASVKTSFVLSMLFLSLVFFSCGNNSGEATQEEGSAMDQGMMGDGMMQDSSESEDGMGNGMMGDGGMMQDGMMQDGMMSEEMHKAMMSKGMGPEMMDDMRVIRSMLMQHEKIDRKVENLENGVRTITTSDDPEVVAAIQKHVRQMHERLKEDKPIRQMDPLFREIFEHADKINMQIEDTENGVIVVETSKDPQVVKLIQQHANRAVSEFAERGMQRAMQPTPLPEGYKD